MNIFLKILIVFVGLVGGIFIICWSLAWLAIFIVERKEKKKEKGSKKE